MEGQVAKLIAEVRRHHPGMNLRDIYFKMRPAGIGRDRFELMGKRLGFCVSARRNYRRTTHSSGVRRFANRLTDVQLKGINQVWQSDITYYEIKNRFFYLTFIQDAYSKLIVGHSVSRSLATEGTTLAALKMALHTRRRTDLVGLILHSDGGGQYYSDSFLALTESTGIINSMCKEAYENGMAERLNGIIKNNYLRYERIETFEDLAKKVDRTVSLYNTDKPHKGLRRMTPVNFESKLSLNTLK